MDQQPEKLFEARFKPKWGFKPKEAAELQKLQPLWHKLVQRKHHGTLDAVGGRPDRHSWYHVAEFGPEGHTEKESTGDGEVSVPSYFVETRDNGRGGFDKVRHSYYHPRQWPRWYNAEDDQFVYFGEEVIDELLKLLERTMGASRDFARKRQKQQEKEQRDKKMRENKALREVEKAITRAEKRAKTKPTTVAGQVQVCMLMKEVDEVAQAEALPPTSEVTPELEKKYQKLEQKRKDNASKLHKWTQKAGQR